MRRRIREGCGPSGGSCSSTAVTAATGRRRHRRPSNRTGTDSRQVLPVICICGRPQAARTVCGSQAAGAVTSADRSAHTGVPLSSRYSTRSRTVHRRAGPPPSCTVLTPLHSAAVR